MRVPVDFTECPVRLKAYSGANGSKIAIFYAGADWLLKFPSHTRRNSGMSYCNSSVCEHIGSRIFEIAGVPSQETVLGTYRSKQREYVAVACRDFTADPPSDLYDFASIKNTVIDSPTGGGSTEIGSLVRSFSEQGYLDSAIVEGRFWEMFVVDALIGNWDRHNGNWGILRERGTDRMSLAPVYDCGSSLFPEADADTMREVISGGAALEERIYNRPTSSVKEGGKRIGYHDFLTARMEEFPALADAVERVVPRIDMSEVASLVDETPCLDGLQREFYKTILTARKERILDVSLKLARTYDPEPKKSS